MDKDYLINFNKPYFTGRGTDYIKQAVANKKISGDGAFTKMCHNFFESRYGFKKVLLTTSCTSALEMAAMLIDIKPGDEVIMPSYTFVSTANAFVLRGAKIVFADSYSDHPNMNADTIEELITPKTKAIVCVHYGGVACDMDKLKQVADAHNLFLIEDAAHAIDSFYKEKPLGSFGHLSAFSFHETKNIISGEGGMLVINDENFIERAEIIREKGTNRSKFFRGEIDKYTWVDIGSSYLPSDIIAAFLFAQCEHLDIIQQKRKSLWNHYFTNLKCLHGRDFALSSLPDYATNNAHMFYIECESENHRKQIIANLKERNVQAIFHYLSLHKSDFYKDKHDGRNLCNSDKFTERLLRLPMYFELTFENVDFVCQCLSDGLK